MGLPRSGGSHGRRSRASGAKERGHGSQNPVVRPAWAGRPDWKGGPAGGAGVSANTVHKSQHNDFSTTPRPFPRGSSSWAWAGRWPDWQCTSGQGARGASGSAAAPGRRPPDRATRAAARAPTPSSRCVVIGGGHLGCRGGDDVGQHVAVHRHNNDTINNDTTYVVIRDAVIERRQRVVKA